MLKIPPELVVHKGNVFYVLYAVGGLLMSLTAGSQCVDVAVRTAQSPANLLRLSNTLTWLMGLRCQKHVAKSKRKQKRLYYSESFVSLLDMTRSTLLGNDLNVFGSFPEKRMNLESTSANAISAKRCRIYFILICGVKSRTVLTLCVGSDSSRLKTYNHTNQLQWLIDFSRKAQARGDVIFLLLTEQTGQTHSRFDASDTTDEYNTTSLDLGLSLLSVVFLWMFLPHVAVFALICVCWKVQQHIQ